MRIRALSLILCLVAAACGGAVASPDPMTLTTEPSEVPAVTSTTSTIMAPTTTTVAPTTTTTDPGVPAPLTGVPGEPIDRQVLIAKLSNAPKGRPQAGINQADLVMEVLVEGGIGRWIAVFHSTYPETVGPVRSLREVDPKLIAPFDARVLSSGGQWTVRQELARVAVDEGDGRLDGYRREAGRDYLYSLMFDTASLPDLGWEGTVAPVLTYDLSAPPGGEDAAAIEVRMSRLDDAFWAFDHDRYFRSQDGSPLVDADGVEITADSIVVVRVETLDTGRRDAAGSLVPDYEVTGRGAAVVFRNGRAFEGEWQRATIEDFFTLTDSAGDPIALPPGRTWIHITPLEGTVTWS